jgi:hypothetical protein
VSFKKLSPELWDIARSIWKKHKNRGLITEEWCKLFRNAGILDAYLREAEMDATRGVIQELSREARREHRPGEAIGNIRIQDKQGEWKWMYKELDDMSVNQLMAFCDAEFRKIRPQRRKTARIYQFGVNKFGKEFTQGLMFGPEDLPEINEDLEGDDEGEE